MGFLSDVERMRRASTHTLAPKVIHRVREERLDEKTWRQDNRFTRQDPRPIISVAVASGLSLAGRAGRIAKAEER
ncbi:hypothetical protein PV327_004463 [Microctonus hyperodae]|uniref:Uncharacterized protein n=1 Tax=Microctonus hyperodae TaxID=165561 RepID=A0AA39FCM1_MICHY|nr:hypothetical protein PV327_004463 [Microctonus hyperodae]